MKFNKGEWSELYAILKLLCVSKLNIVDEKFNVLDSSTFKILGIFVNIHKNKFEYKICNEIIEILRNDILILKIKKEEIEKYTNILLNKIKNVETKTGSFEINEIQCLLETFSDGDKLKSDSNTKKDFDANIYDNKMKTSRYLGYSIKSSLGRPATLLNASSHTNFIYKLSNFTDKDMIEINKINTHNKLIDRIEYMKTIKSKIELHKTESNIFSNNLKLIDTSMDKIISIILLNSYYYNKKNIVELLKITKENNNIELFNNKNSYDKKIKDLLVSISLGMFPSKEWDGKFSADGGMILVENNGEIFLLDSVYYIEELSKYLLENTKLESPSTTRYKMLEVYKENDEFYFKLNLQIRFIK